MSNPWLAQFDAIAAPLFKAAGLADSATYTAPGGQPVPCTVYVDRMVSTAPDSFSGALRDQVTIMLAEVAAPESGGVVTIGAEELTLFELATSDESRQTWWIAL